MNSIIKGIILVTVYCLLFTVLCGCASLHVKEKILAIVDGEPITEGDFKYALTISHRREDLSSAGSLNLSQYVQKLIDDRLIIHEARNAGMDQYPEVKQAIEAYILRESVVRLHDEEIVQKVSVTEKEIKDYCFNVLKREEATDEEFEKLRGSIQNTLRKQKEKERGDEYLKNLREKANIKIDKALLSAIELEGGREEIEKWSKDKRHLVEVNGAVLTVEDFIALITPSTKRTGEDVIYGWIDRKLVDHEALSRHYEMKPDLKKMVYRYENQLLKNTFIKKVIYPQINITEEALKKYYLDKQKDFLKPRRYRIQQITVTTIDDAREILNALGDGADFSWLAKKRSSDSAASRGGEVGWLTKKELPEQIREIIDNLKIGDISPIIEIASYYRIIKLIDKTEEEAEDFVRVKDAVYKAYFNEQLNSILEKDINELKKDSEIIIYGEEIKYLEEKFQK